MKQFKSTEERDDFLEAGYHYDRKGYRSTLAYVSGEQDDLVRAFHATEYAADGVGAAVIRFELDHFGAALESMAHGILLYAITRSMRDGLPATRRAEVPPRQPREDSEDYIRRIAVTNGWIEPGAEAVKDMPAAPELEPAGKGGA